MRVQQMGTKEVIADGQPVTVRVFESRESAAIRRGRKAAIAQPNTDAQWEERMEAMAEYAHVTGHSPLSEPHGGNEFDNW